MFGDFYAVNFTQNLLSPTLEPLAAIIDPLMYKENLTMPKLVVDATGDECKYQCTSFQACMSLSCCQCNPCHTPHQSLCQTTTSCGGASWRARRTAS